MGPNPEVDEILTYVKYAHQVAPGPFLDELIELSETVTKVDDLPEWIRRVWARRVTSEAESTIHVVTREQVDATDPRTEIADRMVSAEPPVIDDPDQMSGLSREDLADLLSQIRTDAR